MHNFPKGFYIDIGAEDPARDSVTLAFYERGWHGINVEPDRVILISCALNDREISLFRLQSAIARAHGTRLRERMDNCTFDIPDVKLIVPRRFTDARGYFSETWNARSFHEQIANVTFVQDNQSFTAKQGTLRGLHFQKPPFAQGKLVRVVCGSILDIAIDLRKGSPTYRQHVAIKLNSLEGAQLWVPPGFLHGFCTLEDATEVFYKVTAYYSPDHDAGVLWNDPDLGINWPVDSASVILSEKDQRLPRLRDMPDVFTYEE